MIPYLSFTRSLGLRFAGLLVATLLLASCATTKVSVRTDMAGPVAVDTIALASTVIGPVFQPVLPLIDAAAFNKRTNDIADDLLAEEEALVGEFRATLLEDLREHVPATFVTVGELDDPEVEPLRTAGTVQTENKNFPVALFAPNDLNVVAFDNAKNVERLFQSTPALQERVRTIARATNAESVIVSYNRLAVVSAQVFGTIGTLRLETHLFVFARSGQEIIEVYGFTKPTTISGKETTEYTGQLAQFPVLSEMMAKELAKHIQ